MTVPYELPPATNLGSVYRGDTIELPIWTATERGVPVEDGGAVIDLTGATVWFTAKKTLSDGDEEAPGFQLSTVAGGVEVIDPVAGLYRVTIPPSATVALEGPMVFQWDVQVRTTEPQTRTVARGTISVHLDVTRVTA
jgi:hypothetical protein